MWIFHQNRCIFTQPLASQLSINLSFDKSSTTVKCEKWSRVKGWEPQPCGARPLSCWSPSPSVPARTPSTSTTTPLFRTCSSTPCPTTPRRWRARPTQGIYPIQKTNSSPASWTMTLRIKNRYWWGLVMTYSLCLNCRAFSASLILSWKLYCALLSWLGGPLLWAASNTVPNWCGGMELPRRIISRACTCARLPTSSLTSSFLILDWAEAPLIVL